MNLDGKKGSVYGFEFEMPDHTCPIYVGSTCKQVTERKSEHLNALCNGRHANANFQRAFLERSRDKSPHLKLLERDVPAIELPRREQYWSNVYADRRLNHPLSTACCAPRSEEVGKIGVRLYHLLRDIYVGVGIHLVDSYCKDIRNCWPGEYLIFNVSCVETLLIACFCCPAIKQGNGSWHTICRDKIDQVDLICTFHGKPAIDCRLEATKSSGTTDPTHKQRLQTSEFVKGLYIGEGVYQEIDYLLNSENLLLAKLGLPLVERPRDYPRRIKHVQ